MPDSFENIEEYESDSDVEVDSDILDEWLNNGKVKSYAPVFSCNDLALNAYFDQSKMAAVTENQKYI